MKFLLPVFFLTLTLAGFSQRDSLRSIEPEHKTSFENYWLLLIALLGLLLLIGLRFWFRRRRNK